MITELGRNRGAKPYLRHQRASRVSNPVDQHGIAYNRQKLNTDHPKEVLTGEEEERENLG